MSKVTELKMNGKLNGFPNGTSNLVCENGQQGVVNGTHATNGSVNGNHATNGAVNGNHATNGNYQSNGVTNGKHLNGNIPVNEGFYKDIFPYKENSPATDEYIHGMVDKVIKFLEDSNSRKEKIVDFVKPEELQKKIDFSLPDEKESLEEINKYVDQILKYSVKTAHPRYFNQLWAGVDTHSMLGEWITAATNTSLYTYEVAPVYILMENYVSEKLLNYAGFNNGESQFFPGGSLCNIAALNLARYKFYPDIKSKGTFGMKPLIIYTSEESHYSIVKGAALLGIGTDHVIKVKTDKKGKMIVSDLEIKINETLAKGVSTPFFVSATAGTTVVGAYDPFNEIADVCEKYGLWMHIDAAWGGSCLFSEKHKYLMNGCNRADSITWDPHKMMNCLLQNSILLLKNKDQLLPCHGFKAKYLFQKDKKLYDVSWDIGDRTFQCGRHNDILKLWLMWKAKGSKGIEEQVNNAFSNARYLAEQIEKRENYLLLREVECTNVCFQYIPPSLIHSPDSEDKQDKLAKIPPIIKERMTLEGTLLIGYQPLKEIKNAFRMITVSPVVNYTDMDFLLDEIERLGKDL